MENMQPQIPQNVVPMGDASSSQKVTDPDFVNSDPNLFKKKKLNWRKIIPLTLTMLISLGAGFWFARKTNMVPEIEKILNNGEPVEEITPEPIVIDIPEPEEDPRIAVFVQGEEGTSNGSIYLKNLRTYEQNLVLDLSDVNYNHLRPFTKNSGNVFVARLSEGAESLWVYWKDGTYQELYNGGSFKYDVAPNGIYVALVVGDALTFINLQEASNPQKVIFEDLDIDSTQVVGEGNLNLYGWSSDASHVWGYYSIASAPYGFFEIYIAASEVTKYDVYDLNLQTGEMALNMDSHYLAYSDYPPIFDVHEVKEFKLSGAPVKLAVYDLTTEKTQNITTASGVPFKPTWIDGNTLEYDSPDSAGRIQSNVSF
jgi:hypothetical protein